nr:PREDICTED: centrosomal protein of 128 kDa-like [Paralichthys olivaceus]
MDTSSESESWDRSQRHSFKRGEAHFRPNRDSGSNSDQAGHISKKFKNLTETLQDMKRQLSKVDQRLELYRDKTEVTSMLGEILKESNNSTSERQVLELKRAMDEMKERDQLSRVEKLSSELEELRELHNRGQMERGEMEASLLECKSSRDEIKSRAIKAVRHWTAKCKRIQAQFQTEKALQAAREKSFQDQVKVLSQQTHTIHTDVNEVLSCLAQHKEELKHKDLSLKQETQELRETLAALKEENQSQAALQAWLMEHQRLEEQTDSQVCCCQRYQDMPVEFQAILKKMTPAHAQVAQRLAKEDSCRKELQRSSSELKGKLTVVLEERAALEQQLQLEREMHQRQVHNMKAMMEDSSINRDHEVQAKMRSHLKKVKACGEKDKELCGVLRAMLARTQDESDKMAVQLRTKNEAYALLQTKCQQLQQELDDKISSSDQRYISELEEKLLQKEEQKEKILAIIGEELDATCCSLANNSKYKQAISQSPTLVKNIPHWLAETMAKLRWLCEEVQGCVTREQCLKKQLQQTRDQLDQQKNLNQSTSSERESWCTEV